MNLKTRCVMEVADFASCGDAVETPDGMYVYIDRGASVLGVAHLDTVLSCSHYYEKGSVVYTPVLDDRLGVYIILDVLPRLGINCDVLLTDGEEMGVSTGLWFDSSKYNWMFQFDRAGTDVVTYQYKTKRWLRAIGQGGFTLGRGTFSDICQMEALGICGANFGTGYYKQHTTVSYAKMQDTARMVDMFAAFYSVYAGVKFQHSMKPNLTMRNMIKKSKRVGDMCILCNNPLFGEYGSVCSVCLETIKDVTYKKSGKSTYATTCFSCGSNLDNAGYGPYSDLCARCYTL